MRVFLIIVGLIFPAFAGTNDCTIVKGTATNAVVRCEARTKSGAQCKRRAQKGKTLCRQHEKIAGAVRSRHPSEGRESVDR